METWNRLVATKLAPPRSSGELIDRPHLLERLASGRERKLTIVSASAGYGKTSLLSQWYAALSSTATVGWISLDSHDNSPAQFFSNVVAAVRERYPDFARGLLTLLASRVRLPTGAVVASLIREFLAMEKDYYLFIDDMHLITDPATLEAFRTLINQSPPWVRFVVAARTRPPLGLARLRAFGYLCEIAGDDLRFNEDEIRTFLLSRGHGTFERKAILSLRERTEGWIAALQLASISLERNDDLKALLNSFSGRRLDIAEFLTAEVLRHLDDEILDFLYRTSILKRICPELANAVTGRTDGRQMLDRVAELNLFLSTLDSDGTWYRYHHLFQEYLLTRLNTRPDLRIAELHLRACDWYAERGYYQDAIEHAFSAGVPRRAAELLELCCAELFYEGQYAALTESIKRVPLNILRDFPRLRLEQVWLLICEWQFETARTILGDVVDSLKGRADADAPYRGEGDSLNALARHREAMLAMFSDDMVSAERLLRDLLTTCRFRHPYLQASIEISHVFARRELFDCDPRDPATARANELFRQATGSCGEAWCGAIEGPGRFLCGDLEGAERTYRRAIETAVETTGEGSALVAMPALLLAELLYERGQVEEARALVDRYLPVAGYIGFVDQLIAGYATGLRLAALESNWDAAGRLYEEGRYLADAVRFERLRDHLLNEWLLQLLRRGHVEEAALLGQREDLAGPAEQAVPRGRVTTRHEIRALSWARTVLALGRADDAVWVLTKWLRHAEARGHARSVVRLAVLLARAVLVLGDGIRARRTLRVGLLHAARSGMKRTFLDEGEPILTLLGEIAAQELWVPDSAVEWARLLINWTPPNMLRRVGIMGEGMTAEAEPLRPREIEILQRVGAGQLNREIAAHLGLTTGTVNWYLHTIYQKLGVSRRTQAIRRAREMGLIS